MVTPNSSATTLEVRTFRSFRSRRSRSAQSIMAGLVMGRGGGRRLAPLVRDCFDLAIGPSADSPNVSHSLGKVQKPVPPATRSTPSLPPRVDIALERIQAYLTGATVAVAAKEEKWGDPEEYQGGLSAQLMSNRHRFSKNTPRIFIEPGNGAIDPIEGEGR